MALFFISYDLRNSRDYQPLYDELSRLNAARILESTWCLKRYDTDPPALRDHFKTFLDADDGVVVSEVSAWATSKTDGTPKDVR